jgi:2-polyprenyl-3-methyl-5-hydroxy-6-metoxy-1,4-benzoquinol methylase
MLQQRAHGPEWMDGPDFGRQEVVETFRFLVPVNRLFGGIRPELSFFRKESRHWDRQQVCRVLDAGGGVGDVAVALARWARRAGYRLQIDAVDKHPEVIQLARERCRDFPEISLSCADVLALHGQAYDYVHASQLLHHFPDEEVVPVVRHLLGLCRRKVVINDLLRAPLAYLATWVFTLGTAPVFRHDARLSVRRGFRLEELRGLLAAGGLHDFRLTGHFFYRFLLVLNREEPSER